MTTFLQDTFTGTNGTALSAHTMDVGSGWTHRLGSAWSIQSNQAQADSGSVCLVTADAGVTNAAVRASIAAPGSGQWAAGVVFRYADASNWWYAQLSDDGSGKLLQLIKSESGATAAMSTVTFGSLTGTHELAVQCYGNLLTVYVDGVDLLEYTSSFNNFATNYGLGTYRGAPYVAVPMDSFEVVRLSRVVCDGNGLSTSAGASAGDEYPVQMKSVLGANWAVVNKGVDGQTTPDMIADAASDIDTLYDATNYDKNVVVCWEGTDDVYLNASAVTAASNLASYCTSRQTAGWKVVVGTLTPRGDFPGTSTLPAVQKTNHETRRQAVNTSLRSGYTSYANALADIAADTRIGDDGDEHDATYYNADLMHLTRAGYGVVAGIMGPAVLASLIPPGPSTVANKASILFL